MGATMSVETIGMIIAIAFGAVGVFVAVRALRSQQTAARRLEDLSSEMYGLIELSRAALSDPELKRRLPELAQYYSAIFEKNRIFEKSFFDEYLRRSLSMTEEAVRRGRLHIEAVNLIDYAVLLLQFAEPGDKVFATSYVMTPKFWDKPAAKTYLREQERLIKERRIEVSRIFIYNDEAARNDPRNVEEMGNQDSMGINVYTAIMPQLEVDLRRDMFVIQGRVAAEYETTIDREELLGLWVWVEPDDVEVIGRRMIRLVDASQKYTRPTP